MSGHLTDKAKCEVIAKFDGKPNLGCPNCRDQFTAEFNGHVVVCAFCHAVLLEGELPDYPNDLNATFRAAAKIGGGDHLVVHAPRREHCGIGVYRPYSDAAACVVNKFGNGDWTYDPSPARAAFEALIFHLTRERS
jgi:hypothetical protein